jgi:hypothetical protein
MGVFFKPWRRKFGVLMLVLACVFMGGWVRSLSIYDSAMISNGDQSYHQLMSSPNWIGWTLIRCTKGSIPVTIRSQYGWRSGDACNLLNSQDPYTPFCMIYCHLESKGKGFNHVKSNEVNPHLIVPYFLITIPLTLLSAFLLLTKPHQSTPKKITEPISNEGQ